MPIRYNTMANSTGPTIIQLSYGPSGNTIYRSLMVGPGRRHANIRPDNLNGTGNTVHDDAGWGSSGVVERAEASPTKVGTYSSTPASTPRAGGRGTPMPGPPAPRAHGTERSLSAPAPPAGPAGPT